MERKLTAILAADVVGFSEMMENDEAKTLNRLKSIRSRIVQPLIRQHGGRTIKLMGDGLLAEFPSVVEAVNCAVNIQNGMINDNVEEVVNPKIQLRIGVNLGDVIVEGTDIYGDGVNVAARLESLANPGGICISSLVHESIGNRVDEEFMDVGLHEVKNISKPVHVFKWPTTENEPLSVQKHSLALPDKPSIVVLPFDNMTKDTDQDYYADGIVEAITAALANIRLFFVIARNTAFTYKGRSVDIKKIGRELGVRYVLEGSVQRAGDRLRITAQLIETEQGAHVWARKFDGRVDDIFDLQDKITELVAGALQPSIQLAEIERVKRKRPQDLGAYDLTMRALPHVWTLHQSGTVAALVHLDKALEIDPDYPLALSLAAWCHAQRSVYNWDADIKGSKHRALRLAEKSAEFSSEDPLVLAVLGTVHTIIRNFGTARMLLERAVSLDSNSAWGFSRLGWLETYADRLEPALEYFHRSQRLSPLDPLSFNTYVGMASAYYGAGNFEDSLNYYFKALEQRPQAIWIYRSMVPALMRAGRLDEARGKFATLVEHYPDLTCAQIREAMAFSERYMDSILACLTDLGMPEE